MSPFTPESRRRQQNRVALGDERDELETATLASRAGQHVDPEHAFRQLRPSEPRAPSRGEVLDQVFALRGGLGALGDW